MLTQRFSALLLLSTLFDRASAFTSPPRPKISPLLNSNVDKGFNLLEIASKVVPQGRIVQAAKESWKFAWKRMMTELAPQDQTGNYQRPSYSFGDTIGSPNHPIDSNRYHLYLGNPCPWCHRAKLVVEVMGLSRNNAVGVSRLVDDPIKASRGGWVFEDPSASLYDGVNDLRELYELLSPGFQGRCTAPLLIDKKKNVIVSNESKDIVRMLPKLMQVADPPTNDEKSNSPPSTQSGSIYELCPSDLSAKITDTNEWVYRLINNGVYRCGFSTTQQAYDRASADVREGLSRCEELLGDHDYLCGDRFTESDVMLLPTALRFDAVYAPLFKAGGAHLCLAVHYPNTYAWLRRCWSSVPGVPESVDIPDACASYYKQLFPLNPGGIVPTMVTAKDLGLE